MSLLKYLLFFIYIFVHITLIYCADPLVTVNTPRGTVVGYHFDQGNDTTQAWYGQADTFLGIPFAIPPLGEFRYKQPRPITQYPGPSPYNATYYRPVCIQQYVDTSSEDCLYVNIWSANASSTAKYPVLLYIHGGGLSVGNGRFGQGQIVRNLVAKGVVVASLQYRLSWLATSDYSRRFSSYLADNYPVCTRGYTSKITNTTCYEAFGIPVPWDVAQGNCSTNSYGSLVTIGSAFENSNLLAYAKSAYPNCSSFYIGLFKSQYVPNSWNWANYDPSSYRNWKSGMKISY